MRKANEMKLKLLIRLLLLALFMAGFAPVAEAFYNPSAGRWLSRDPIQEQGGLNLHGFVSNDPENYNDWLGLKTAKFIIYMDGFTPEERAIIKSELKRIVDSCLKRCSADCAKKNTVTVSTLETSKGWKELDLGEKWITDEVLQLSRYAKIDRTQTTSLGYSHGDTIWLGRGRIEDASSASKVSLSMAIATVIAHELYIHTLLDWSDPKAGLNAPTGSIDNTFGGGVGGDLSDGACKALCKKLTLDL